MMMMEAVLMGLWRVAARNTAEDDVHSCLILMLRVGMYSRKFIS